VGSFDRIPHDKLVAEVARRIADPHILKLIRSFLKSGIMDHGKLAPSEEGTPQGGIASPLLANIYLHRFDEWYYHHYGTPDGSVDKASYSRWYRATSRGKSNAATQIFRYADDWIIAVRGTNAQAQEIKEECKRFLQEELGLELSEEKTVITHIIDGFDFLGYHIFRSDLLKVNYHRTMLRIRSAESTSLRDDRVS
jgi:RNA-directed DNA polymerase